ncbi:cysteine synthase CysM [Sulfurivirga sp.]|uniref:cysteine synthase CysM n=1 Tax=Sulfurivirga sp. TaxID=2614236 RepID=UPI0025F5E36C|nr:cysteine synthase CysM [Sulfurivirga sp.]
MRWHTLEDTIGNTPLVRIRRLAELDNGSVVLAKLEGNNPAGSVKDRPAFNMIRQAEARGEIRPGDTLIEATSGNTGIALAMAASMMGYRMKLIMPENMSLERRASMAAFGAELVLVSMEEGMEGARDLAKEMEARGEGKVLDQFSNPDNWRAHYLTTGPEIWRQTEGGVTHFVSAMGTTGTIMGVSHYLKEQNPQVQVVGVQPAEGASIPGIRRWPPEYLPRIFDPTWVDELRDVTQEDAEETTRRLARQEGIFAGISSGGAMHVALQVAAEQPDSVVVTIVCDRGDRYLSTGVFPPA